MHDWQVSLFVQAQAVVVRVEGYKAANEQERIAGNSPQYGEDSFCNAERELIEIAQSIAQ